MNNRKKNLLNIAKLLFNIVTIKKILYGLSTSIVISLGATLAF